MADESILPKPPLVAQNGDPLSTDSAATQGQAAQIAALKAELESLKESVSAVASTAKSLVGTSTNAVLEDTEEILKRNVFASVAIAAFIGYLWGRSDNLPAAIILSVPFAPTSELMKQDVNNVDASSVSPFRAPDLTPVFFAILPAMLAEAMAGCDLALLAV